MIERRNPIPAGRYWMVVFVQNTHAWNDWYDANRATVRIVSTERIEDTLLEKIQSLDTNPAFDWILFTISAPTTRWTTPALGYPNLAPSNVKGYSDTVQSPTVDTGPKLGLFAAGAGILLLIGIWIGHKIFSASTAQK